MNFPGDVCGYYFISNYFKDHFVTNEMEWDRNMMMLLLIIALREFVFVYKEYKK